ncbi:MAG TPA: S-adenosylmethionine:tRNA ribosyltransferase-isomerase [Bacteroidales bacterium]|nr:S-adenosylmethionine:tRNA ribosyltransferase-isomerase [Bacteroidales bacterium]
MPDIIPPEYYYDLPAGRIAQHPLGERDSSRLLVYRNNSIQSSIFRCLADFIPAGSLLVFNNTKVIRARLIFRKASGTRIEVFCLEPLDPSEYSVAFTTKSPVEWKCLVGNLKRWRDGVLETSLVKDGREIFLRAERISKSDETFRIRFSWNDKDSSFGDIIELTGHVPLPPYISREDEAGDASAYQTIYARVKGSVAAPTAGLHFTPTVFDNLKKNNIRKTELTLHVGAGTFQPVKAGNLSEHVMHTEHFFVSRPALEEIIENAGKIIAVGTTSVRTLESLYWLGVKVKNNLNAGLSYLTIGQWEPYESEPGLKGTEALGELLSWMRKNNLQEIKAPTRLLIAPGYRFRVIDGMITNFHQPGSTLLLLVSAWTNNRWKEIYDYALANDFRFLSYGDSSILLK